MQKTLTLFAALMILFTSCKKNVTEVTEVINPSIGIKFSIKPSDWQTTDGYSYSASMQIPELDDKIYEHGAVLVYVSFGTEYYEALPQVFEGLSFGAIHSKGFVTIDYHALDGGTVEPPEGNVSVKVILIPTTSLKAKPGVDLKNMKAVEKAFLNK